ncbi:putative calmodulin-binding protein Sha1 [Aspergillus foveolatus]|uniref:putative calmodulin-binding protein Sha1 n=1 Tax=Aspergillus foveolatus TaxID=210207 RepID=UPI003CCD6B55
MSSLFLYEASTPCPQAKGARASNDSGNGSDPMGGLWDEHLGNYDDTRNIEFTTEIRAPILGAKPKRRTRTTTSFSIHSDYDEKPQATVHSKGGNKSAGIAPTNRKTSLLAQPAQRFRSRPRVSFVPSPLKHCQQHDKTEPENRSTRPDVQKNNELLKRINAASEEVVAKHVLKDARRTTAFSPPEDTTAASVFMGIFSPLKCDVENYTSKVSDVRNSEPRITKERQANPSIVTSSGRVPLKPSSNIGQESCDRADIPGQNGGKENIPPGMNLAGVKGRNFRQMDGPIGDKLNCSNLISSKPLATRKVNQPVKVDSQTILKASVSTAVNERRTLSIRTKNPATRSCSSSSVLSSKTASLTAGSTSRNSLKHLRHEYPLASASITNPAMYNDNWLSHQEVILTQLINGVLNHPAGGVSDPAILRNELLQLYQGAYFTTLYKRLHASLVYGALSIPKDVLKERRLRQDLGMKRKFIDIWVQTYDSNALRAALEAVTGRIIPLAKANASSIHKSANGASPLEKALTKKLAKFLDAFLIQNQDMDRSSSEHDTDNDEALAGTYRRTLLRSMMMVILLDKARTSPKTSLSPRLFLASSPYKSSSAVLQALTRFLLPSCGNVGKAFAQLDCQLTYEQHPLEEYDFVISNLAIDLRDGIRLARLVELLLYPSSRAASISVCRWSLSRHLKFPCLSRAVKMSNAKVALEALATTDKGKQLVTDIRAADIVDGHREKTIALLWGLVSNWGLSELVDIYSLKKEILRLGRRYDIEYKNDTLSADDFVENNEPIKLLRQWAFLVAQLRGLAPNNLTTDMANGKVYECILDEYEGYIYSQSTFTEGRASLRDRLRALGCSEQFIKIISPGLEAHILNTPSTTGALAYLCSCLLPIAKRARAATVIQNAWRRVLDHREAEKRAMARDIARQCAAVVQTRDQILWAKSVIVHWWRLNRARRRRRRITVASMKSTTIKRQSRIPGRTSTKIPLRCVK